MTSTESSSTISRLRPLGVAVAVVATFVIGLSSAAVASHGTPWESLNLQANYDNDGSFSGSWRFLAQGTSNGGFQVSGSVCDNNSDGDGVYGQGRVEGYGWSSRYYDLNGSQSGCRYDGREFYDPQTTWVNRGQYKVCVERFFSDECGSSQWYYRH